MVALLNSEESTRQARTTERSRRLSIVPVLTTYYRGTIDSYVCGNGKAFMSKMHSISAAQDKKIGYVPVRCWYPEASSKQACGVMVSR